MIELQTGYTVLTKEGCKWCTKVKSLLTSACYISCDKLLEDKETFFKEVDALAGKQYRTFPMVFFDKVFIGGYEDVKLKIDTELTFDAVYF